MYYQHLSNLIVLFLILPSLVQLLTINTDVLIIPNHARPGFVLLEEMKPSRSNEFQQCINDNHRQLNINIDEKYGDLILNQTVENQIFNQQQLLCTIHRNEVNRYSFVCVCVFVSSRNQRDLISFSSTREIEHCRWTRIICLIDVYTKQQKK